MSPTPPPSIQVEHHDDDSSATSSNEPISWFNSINPFHGRHPAGGFPADDLPNERSSLLPKPSSDYTTDTYESYPLFSKPWLHVALAEFRLLLGMSIPVIFAYTLQMSLQTISVLVVGRISPDTLAAAAFSYMFAMSTAWLVGLGGTTALDTLCSSSFTASKDPHELGILLQRAFIVLGMFYLPICALWWWSEPLFIALGQDPELSHQAQGFLRAMIPGGLGYIYFEAGKKYLQAQGIMRAGTWVLLITSPLSLLLNWVCVYPMRMGLIGAPVATGVCYWISFGLLVAYARWIGGWECWGGWDRKCLKNMGTFARLAALGFIHVGTEWWAFEIVALVAGRLGTLPLTAQSVIMTTDQVLNTIPFGISVAASTRIGNLLGSRSPKSAAFAAHTAAWLSILLGSVVLIIMMATKNHYAKMFTNDPAVISLTASVMPYVALFQIADGLNGSCGGVLRGMGRQHVGAMVNVVSYYAGALPGGMWLAFHGWGLEGLWIGQCFALYLVGGLEWAIVAWSDWDKQVRRAFERLSEDDRTESGPLE